LGYSNNPPGIQVCSLEEGRIEIFLGARKQEGKLKEISKGPEFLFKVILIKDWDIFLLGCGRALAQG
jgi:hypothetical protein